MFASTQLPCHHNGAKTSWTCHTARHKVHIVPHKRHAPCLLTQANEVQLQVMGVISVSCACFSLVISPGMTAQRNCGLVQRSVLACTMASTDKGCGGECQKQRHVLRTAPRHVPKHCRSDV